MKAFKAYWSNPDQLRLASPGYGSVGILMCPHVEVPEVHNVLD